MIKTDPDSTLCSLAKITADDNIDVDDGGNIDGFNETVRWMDFLFQVNSRLPSL